MNPYDDLEEVFERYHIHPEALWEVMATLKKFGVTSKEDQTDE